MWEYFADGSGGTWEFFEDVEPITLTTTPTVTTSTPNINLQVPATDAENWNIQINSDLSQIDLMLSGRLPVPGINVTGPASIPLLTTWSPIITYAADQTVLYTGTLYASLIDANLDNVPPNSSAQWSLAAAGGGPSGGVVIVPSSATPVFDGLLGTCFQLTLSVDVTSSTTQNLTPGVVYLFSIIQPASTAYLFQWPATMINPQPIALVPGAESLQPVLALVGSSTVTTGPITYLNL
jgi:hypothetical protein